MLSRHTAEQYEANDPTFVDDLRTSIEVVWVAAQWLYQACNCDVTINRIDLRKSVDEIDSFVDRGDLLIERGNGPERIEVKHRPRLHFTPHHYPYPSLIVDVCHTWDRAQPKPSAYLIFSDDMRTLAIVRASSCPQWQRQERFDKRKNRMRTFYFCPAELVRFVSLRGPSGVGPVYDRA